MNFKKDKKLLFLWILCCVVVLLRQWIQFSIDRFLDTDQIYSIPQSTILVDKNGVELFRFFEEDRKREKYDSISPSMIDAIVSVEDESFWKNTWIDRSSILRAAYTNFMAWYNWWWQIQWWSTITQQIIKNVYLTNEKTLSRKFKEIILARRLTSRWTLLFEQEYDIDTRRAQYEAKKLILEAYLNVVFYWNHAYWIDAAARQYFQTSPSELTVLQSSILASLPQAPSLYNPTRNQSVVLGHWEWWEVMYLHGENMKEVYSLIREKFNTYTTLWKSVDSCITAINEWASVVFEEKEYMYNHWRKDWVLCRLYDQWFIDEQWLFSAFLEWETLDLFTARFPIKAPHFVFYVQNEFMGLPEIRETWWTFQQAIQQWFTIHTSLDYDSQVAAEDSLSNYKTAIKKMWWNNRALVHVDSRSWEIRSYVWSEDYFNDEIDWQVDVIQAIRQSGSTIKPFIYAYLFKHYPITKKGSIVDLPLRWDWPANHDLSFWWKITIETALAWSRNLPVVRLFYTLWWKEVLVPYLQSLWFEDLKNDKEYAYPLVLWADESTLEQLAQAYIQLSKTWFTYPKITWIHTIKKPWWDIFYNNPWSIYEKEIPDTVGDMIWSILSNRSALPQNRKWLRNLPVDNIALKTWTSDVKVRGKPYPRDALSVLYTAQDVIVSWAWNTDWSAMWPKAFWWEVNHYSIRQYLQALVDDNKIIDQPRITKVNLNKDNFYAWIDHEEFNDDQRFMLWRGIR